MISPWRNPLPLKEYTATRVVVYFYSGRWVPIMFYSLADAIELYQQVNQLGQEIFIFPVNVVPGQFDLLEKTNLINCLSVDI